MRSSRGLPLEGPLSTRSGTPHGEPLAYIRDVVLPYKGQDCILWPYGKTGGGYASVRVEGKQRIASRYICELTHGNPPSSEYEAAHSCNNGHLGCVAPAHLAWQTTAENVDHKIASGNTSKGTRNPRNVLSEDQVREIRRLKGTIGARKIGLIYGVCETTILNIHRGTKWGWLP